jgi:hypothetical protein
LFEASSFLRIKSPLKKILKQFIFVNPEFSIMAKIKNQHFIFVLTKEINICKKKIILFMVQKLNYLK